MDCIQTSGGFCRYTLHLDLGRGQTFGLVTLRLESEGGKAILVPLAAWKRAAQDLTVRFDEPGIAHPLTRPDR